VSCGENINAASGTILSPKNGTLYPSETLCVWTITIPRGKIQLNFTAFDLELATTCQHDSLTAS